MINNNADHLIFRENTENGFGVFYNIKNFVYSGKSEFQRIDIFDTEDFGRIFALDGITMTRETDEFIYHEMIAHIPIIIHPEPKKVLVIGGGDGGTVREVLKHESVEEVVLCEIDREVIEASKKYLPSVSCGLSDGKVKIFTEDGSEFIKKYNNYFDAVIIDSTDPTEGQGGLLFTEDFYRNCYNAMTENGVFSAETEDPFLHRDWMKLSYERISSAFTETHLYMGYVPQYPPGTWTWTFASKGLHPLMDFNSEKINNLENLKYYNSEMHVSAFSLPNFVKDIIK